VFTRENPVDSVVAPDKKKTGLFGGLFGGGSSAKGKGAEEEDADFEGFSFHGSHAGRSVLD
jgi:hypothetical protein